MTSEDNDSPSTFSGKLDLASFAFTSSNLSPSFIPIPTKRPATPMSPVKHRRRRPQRPPLLPSFYARLPLLPDALAPDLYILFVGLNPGLETARTGHAYAHPSNLFWKLLHSSGITPSRLEPAEDHTLPARFRLGLTNIVERPSRNAAELTKAEMDAGVAVLERKARETRAEVICIVGKSVWESIWRMRHGRSIRKEEFTYGFQQLTENMGCHLLSQDEEHGGDRDWDDKLWKGSRVFVATSTSGLAASLKPAEKEKIWRELGEWLERRRQQDAKNETEEHSQGNIKL